MKETIKDSIKNFIVTSKENRFDFIEGCGYEKPLVGFAATSDPIFQDYKTIIGETHLTPAEAFERTFGKDSVCDGTVISIALPVNKQVVKSNRQQKQWPSKEWTLLRTFGDEGFIPKVSEYLISGLAEMGYRAVAPRYCDWFKVYPTENGIISNWSERHIAFAAGLGTFSLNDAMITEKGICVKFLSVVTNMKLQADVRTAKSHTENCLYLSDGTCGACIKRCPVEAISKDGHDKIKCYAYAYGEASQQLAVSLGASEKAGSGCGLCQSGVPCEYKNPRI